MIIKTKKYHTTETNREAKYRRRMKNELSAGAQSASGLL